MQITHDRKKKQFIAVVNGGTAYLSYNIEDKTIDLFSTFVPEQARGQKVADLLVREALKFAREQNLEVIPSCSYVARWLQAHPEETR